MPQRGAGDGGECGAERVEVVLGVLSQRATGTEPAAEDVTREALPCFIVDRFGKPGDQLLNLSVVFVDWAIEREQALGIGSINRNLNGTPLGCSS